MLGLATVARLDEDEDDILAAAVGAGHVFGLYRWAGNASGEGWQLSAFGTVFSQFNLDAPSSDLINTDFLAGIPLSYRRGRFATRFRLFHQSSHLGDELLLSGRAPERKNLSVEIADVLASGEWGNWRLGPSPAATSRKSRLAAEPLSTGLVDTRRWFSARATRFHRAVSFCSDECGGASPMVSW